MMFDVEHTGETDKTQDWAVALVGVGHLGQAIAHYDAFFENGFCITALFDNDPAKIGQQVGGVTVLSIDTMLTVIRERQIKLAVLAVPAPQAQAVANTLVEAGVRAILNYAPVILHVPKGVWVRYIDPMTVLYSMTYDLTQAC